MLNEKILGGFFRFSRNPLGIIALFIVLIYGVAGYVTASSALQSIPQLILTIFLSIFPFAVLWSFHQLVSNHFFKLFGPQDTGQAEFVRLASPYLPGAIVEATSLLEAHADVKEAADEHSEKAGVHEPQIDLQAQLLGNASELDRTSLFIDAIWSSKETFRKRMTYKTAFQKSKDIDDILANETNRSAIFDVLNTLNSIAHEIYSKNLDPKDVRKRVRLALNVYWPNALKVITKIRQETGNTALYEDLERLGKDWRSHRTTTAKMSKLLLTKQ